MAFEHGSAGRWEAEDKIEALYNICFVGETCCDWGNRRDLFTAGQGAAQRLKDLRKIRHCNAPGPRHAAANFRTSLRAMVLKSSLPAKSPPKSHHPVRNFKDLQIPAAIMLR
ncbi:hypothetical protein GCM10010909_37400 [Acidocella aquatica]|uniref:Uncharacterized protein n=1 Tax=Acidocella aquatica TaxID=1922313 RepID=A0ABQ6ACL2_9PROT|nr:hypothetical protein GCM10010909_37400 [Acidocella aquatica]